MNPVLLTVYDDQHADLGPLTDLRPVFSLRNGAHNNRVRIECTLGQMAAALIVPGPIAGVQRPRETDAVVNPEATRNIPRTFFSRADRAAPWRSATANAGAPVLFVNGRWTGHDNATAERVCALQAGDALRDRQGEVIAFCVSADRVDHVLGDFSKAIDALGDAAVAPDAALLRWPWHLLEYLLATLAHDLRHTDLPRCQTPPVGVTVIGDSPLFLHPDAKLLPHTVINTTLGPVAIDAGAIVQPFCLIEGPAYVGRGTEIAAHTALRTGNTIGACCKIGGEIKASIVGDFTNKAHAGYLGNAVVGQWCNLGAGTTASNLKNTYGLVRMQLRADAMPQDTGRQFQGPVIGDFVRTAIGTLIPTGACIGTGSCLVAAGFAPKFVPAMTFLTDAGPEPMDHEAFFRTAERMMQRRSTALTDAERACFAAFGGL